MEQIEMKQSKVFPLVLRMGLPMMLSMLVNSLYNIVDSYFVAKINEEAMTALSLVYPIQNVVTAVSVGFGIGINATIAYFLGANERKKADHAASLGMLLNGAHGALLMVFCFLFMPHFLSWFTKNSMIYDQALLYSNYVFACCIPITIAIGYEKIFQAVGRMEVSMICMMIGFVTNIVLDPLFIFGIGFFPKWGIMGAAVATDIGQIATLLGYLVFYVVRPIPVSITRNCMKPTKEMCARLYKIGLPATLNMALPSVQISVLNGMLSAFSGSYVLVLGAYYKLQTFLYLTANGVVQGMRPIIGYNYGAGEKERVKKIFSVTLLIIVTFMAAGTILSLSIPSALIGIFTENPDTIAIGATALRIISIGFIVSSLSVTASGALEGLSRGTESLVITFLRYIGVMLPLAGILCRLCGAVGCFAAFAVTEWFVGIVAYVIYQYTYRKIM